MKILHNGIPKIKTTVLLVLAAFVFIGCKNDTDDNSPIPIPLPTPTTKQFVSAQLVDKVSLNQRIEDAKAKNDTEAVEQLNKLKTESFKKFKSAMMKKAEKGTVQLKSKDGKTPNKVLNKNDVENLGADLFCPYVATYNIKYKTTSANGEPITASARALINYGEIDYIFGTYTFYAETDAILLHCHTTQLKNSDTPISQKGFGGSEYGILYGEAWNDIMVVSPDYEGYGDTKNRVHPYLIQDATARQCYDAACAETALMTHSPHTTDTPNMNINCGFQA